MSDRGTSDLGPVTSGPPPPPSSEGEGRGQQARDVAREQASHAAGQAKDVAGTASDQGREVAGTAAEGARQVTAEARQHAGQITREASAEARQMVTETADQLKGQASSQTERAAGGLRRVASQLEALTGGRPEEAGATGDYARQATDRVSQLASRLEERGVDGVLDDVQRFARRRPGVFLLGAAAAGFAAGRLLRGAQAAKQDQTQPDPTGQQPPTTDIGRAPAVTTGDLGAPPVDPAPFPPAGTAPPVAPEPDVDQSTRVR